jgi:hypothetical protein
LQRGARCNSAPGGSPGEERFGGGAFGSTCPEGSGTLIDSTMSGQKPGFGVAVSVLLFCRGSEFALAEQTFRRIPRSSASVYLLRCSGKRARQDENGPQGSHSQARQI